MKPTRRAWLLYAAALVVIVATFAWWQHVENDCRGEVARGMWNQPVCVERTPR